MKQIQAYEPEVMSERDFLAGLAPFICRCGTVLTPEGAEELQVNDRFDCFVCDAWVSTKDIKKNVSYDCRHLLNDRTAKKAVWYHATTRKNWMADLASNRTGKNPYIPYVHIGTLDAAKDLAWSSYFNEGKTRSSMPVYLYEVKLSWRAKMSSEIAVDTNKWDTYVDETDSHRADAIRYVNTWEAAGSISMLVDYTKLVVRRVRVLELKDCSTNYLGRRQSIAA